MHRPRAPINEPIAEPAPILIMRCGLLRRSRIEYRTTCRSWLGAARSRHRQESHPQNSM